MTKITLFMGPTGSGKSVQAQALIAHHSSWAHLSSGDLLRKDPIATAAIAAGDLVTSNEVERVVSQALLGAMDKAPVVILDGFPRTVDQVRWLDLFLMDNNATLASVIVFDVSAEIVYERLASRGRGDDGTAAVDAKLAVYHRDVMPVVAYYTGEELVTRVDGAQSVDILTKTIEEQLNV